MAQIKKIPNFIESEDNEFNNRIRELFNTDIFKKETFLTSDIFNENLDCFCFFFITSHITESEWQTISELKKLGKGRGELYFHEIYPKGCRDCYHLTKDVTYDDLMSDEHFDLYLVSSSGGLDYLIFSDSGDWAIYSSHYNVSFLAFNRKIHTEVKSIVAPYVEEFADVVAFLEENDYVFDESVLGRYKQGYLIRNYSIN